MAVNLEQQKLWQERVAQWRARGLSQRAHAIEIVNAQACIFPKITFSISNLMFGQQVSRMRA